MKRLVYILFIILFEARSIAGDEPSICFTTDFTNCSSSNLNIHVITNVMLLITTPQIINDKYGPRGNTVCSERQHKISVPLREVAFWENGDAIHIPSLSTFSKTESCVEVNCQNGEEKRWLNACIEKPVVPICSELETTINNLEEKAVEQNTELKIGDHISEVKTKTAAVKIECDENEKQYNISVQNDGTTDLAIHGNLLHLVHKHSLIALPNHIPSPKFCLHEKSGIGPVKSSYCFPDRKNILEKTCRGNNCVQKCCQLGYIYDSNYFSCIPAFQSNSLWQPKFFDPYSYTLSSDSSFDYDLVIDMPHCAHFYIVPPFDDLKLLSNGTLLKSKGNLFFPPGRYCIDNFFDGEVIIEHALACFEDKPKLPPSACSYFVLKIYPVLLLISGVFLLLTIITYAMVPELRAKMQSKCLLSSISALMVAYMALAMGQLASSHLSQSVCIVLGVFIQFSILASFFWLNVMCFDIWCTLRSVQPSRDSGSNPKKKFIIYSCYGWGCPLVISSITAILQLVVNPKHQLDLYLPRIGETDCFFSSNDPITRWIYLYSFICVIIVFNTIFFIHLAIIIIRAQQSSEIVLGKKGQQREWIKLYIKLFFVMGVSWLFEAISWQKDQCGVWIATDIINALRGFFIFVIFVCKKDVYRKLKGRRNPLSQMTSTIQSSLFRSSARNQRESSTKVPRQNVTGLLELGNPSSSQQEERTTISTNNI